MRAWSAVHRALALRVVAWRAGRSAAAVASATLGVLLGLLSAAPPATATYAAHSARIELDPERLQLLAALATAAVCAAVVSYSLRSARLGALAGWGVVVSGVMLPALLMSLREEPPAGLSWSVEPSHLIANEVVLGMASGLLVLLAASAGALARAVVRWDRAMMPRLRHGLSAVALLCAAFVLARPAAALAMYGPTHAIHRIQTRAVAADVKSNVPTCPQGASSTTTVQFQSRLLGGQREAVVQLPAGYPDCGPQGGYVVIYLLHGDPGGDHDWLSSGSQAIFDAAQDAGHGSYIVVYPDGNGPHRWSDWVDTADGSWRIGTFVSTELVAYVDDHYRTAAIPSARYIGGLSSGGFGAPSLALSHPETFGGFLAFSGYYRTGLAVSASRDVPNSASPDRLASLMPPSAVHAVIGTGRDDLTFTSEAQRFHDQLRRAGWDVTYIDGPGGHSWHLWPDLLWRSMPSLHGWSTQSHLPGGHR